MKKLIYALALALPMFMMGQEKDSGAAKDIDKPALAGRPVTDKPIIPALPSDCNESGTVVFTIEVDRAGAVKTAKVAKGTTNETECLIAYAKAIAMATRFTAKEDAPELQEGTLTYNFKLE
ncbi:hypothetical protein AM493_00580 [Flavobacterium akiainvivens]|uniref:TonB C-terminal domain-containing protein n=1 Tax=Flavobacterium akiainvivens TaxID=1202724 RepID=A0A0M8M8G7_9FLAO|nr:hypothetical protein [Flavobacterium akiainvivens]KOS04705.1 hypothetical protein AM493_00580 [Flavobacterium akiainvivens]SFQ64830.1 hypothetical protein SAMN05444144_1125 [Flavobacterium akiainvivens]